MQRILLIALFLGPMLAGSRLNAQATTVKVNLATQAFEAPLPYGEAIILRGAVPETVDSVVLNYGEAGNGAGVLTPPPWRRVRGLVTQTDFIIPIRSLRPDVLYDFEFVLYGKTTESSSVTLIQLDSAFIDSRDRLHGIAVMRDSTVRTRTPVYERITLTASARSQATQRFDADIGIGRGGESGYVGLVSHAHFFPFAPINKKTDLAALNGVAANLRQRVSIFAGLSLEELDADIDVEPLFGVGTPVAGVGIRGFLYWPGVPPRLQPVLQPLRLNVGVIWFEQESPNPLVSDKDLMHDVFFSVTADIELKNVLGPLLALF